MTSTIELNAEFAELFEPSCNDPVAISIPKPRDPDIFPATRNPNQLLSTPKLECPSESAHSHHPLCLEPSLRINNGTTQLSEGLENGDRRVADYTLPLSTRGFARDDGVELTQGRQTLMSDGAVRVGDANTSERKLMRPSATGVANTSPPNSTLSGSPSLDDGSFPHDYLQDVPHLRLQLSLYLLDDLVSQSGCISRIANDRIKLTLSVHVFLLVNSTCAWLVSSAAPVRWYYWWHHYGISSIMLVV